MKRHGSDVHDEAGFLKIKGSHQVLFEGFFRVVRVDICMHTSILLMLYIYICIYPVGLTCNVALWWTVGILSFCPAIV